MNHKKVLDNKVDSRQVQTGDKKMDVEKITEKKDRQEQETLRKNNK